MRLHQRVRTTPIWISFTRFLRGGLTQRVREWHCHKDSRRTKGIISNNRGDSFQDRSRIISSVMIGRKHYPQEYTDVVRHKTTWTNYMISRGRGSSHLTRQERLVEVARFPLLVPRKSMKSGRTCCNSTPLGSG